MILQLKRFARPTGESKFRLVGTMLIFGCMCVLYAIAAAETTDETHILPLSAMELRRIALMPFLKGQFESPDGLVDKPLSQPLSRIVLERQYLRDDANQVLTRIVADSLRIRFGEKLIHVKQAMSVFEQISEDHTLDTPRKLAKVFGDRLQTELVVVGSVWRFRDRDSVKDMPEVSASVAFEIYLVEVATGNRLWRRKFDETQKTVSEDVIRGIKQLKMGARWLTADELARYGVREVFKKFPIR